MFGRRRSDWEGDDFASALGQLLTTDDRYQTVDSAGDADKICLVESNQFKTADYVDEILADPMINSFADRCFCINYEDDALGILQGNRTLISEWSNDCSRRLGGYPTFG
jgi:hypothetical protein